MNKFTFHFLRQSNWLAIPTSPLFYADKNKLVTGLNNASSVLKASCVTREVLSNTPAPLEKQNISPRISFFNFFCCVLRGDIMGATRRSVSVFAPVWSSWQAIAPISLQGTSRTFLKQRPFKGPQWLVAWVSAKAPVGGTISKAIYTEHN